MGHETVLATITLFGRRKSADDANNENAAALKPDEEFLFVDNIDEKEDGDAAGDNNGPKIDVKDLEVFALLEFEKVVVISLKSKGKELLYFIIKKVTVLSVILSHHEY